MRDRIVLPILFGSRPRETLESTGYVVVLSASSVGVDPSMEFINTPAHQMTRNGEVTSVLPLRARHY